MVMSRWDLLVVGAGYWGSGIAYEAAQKGWKVAVVDDGDLRAGSRNASGICDPKAYKSSVFSRYWPPEWNPSELDDSIAWLIDQGGYWVDEWFWNRFQGTTPRAGARCVYLDGGFGALIPYRIQGKILDGEPEGGFWNIRLENREGKTSWVEARRLAVAAGYRTDEVLDSLGLPGVGITPLYGRGLLARGSPSREVPVSVMIRPYTKHTVRPWKGRPHDGSWFRIGDTAEEEDRVNSESGRRRWESLLTVGRSVLDVFRPGPVIQGYRPVAERFLVEKVSGSGPPVAVATGGHRLGLGLTGLVARKVMEVLE